MSDFKLTGSDVFGRYCRIEQFRYCKPNEMHIYKVVSSIRTNTWCEVPYKEASKERWHDRMEDCILAIHCGIDETKVQRFRIADVEFVTRNECDRDALLDLADTMEGYAMFCKERSIQVGNNIVECYASLIREAVNACEGDSDAPTAGDDVKGGIDAHADGNEAADGARTPSIEVFQWVKDHGGLDEVKRRVWASNELEAKLRSRERKIERLKKQLGYADAKNAERRAGAKWLKEHGGLDAVRESVEQSECRKKLLDCFAMRLGFESLEDSGDIFKELEKRLMPEGMEWLVEAWPRFEDDAPVKLGDMALIDGYVDMVEAVQIWIHGKPVIYGDGGSQQLDKGERVNRPAPKVLDADGVEIRVGDRLYDTDTGCGRTVRAVNDNGTVEFEGYENRGWFVRFLTHQRPVLDADGVPIREGDTVYVLDFDEPLTVKGFTDDGSVLMSFHDENSLGYKPSKLTHERPDSWELLEADCSMNTGVYTRERMGIEVDKVPAKESRRIDMMRDLVRRAKKLAGDA